MFKNNTDEPQLLQAINAWGTEVGVSNIVISLPKHWYDIKYSLEPAKLEFTTENTVEIRAWINNQICYEMIKEVTV